MSEWKANRTPEPPHPFSHTVAGDGWVLVGGIGGHRPDGSIAADLDDQVRTAIATITHLLELEGSSLSEVVHFRPYLTDRADAPAMDAILRELLPQPRPVGGVLSIVGLVDARMLVEFEVWARRGAHLTPTA